MMLRSCQFGDKWALFQQAQVIKKHVADVVLLYLRGACLFLQPWRGLVLKNPSWHFSLKLLNTYFRYFVQLEIEPSKLQAAQGLVEQKTNFCQKEPRGQA
jgi:hypothetical protein